MFLLLLVQALSECPLPARYPCSRDVPAINPLPFRENKKSPRQTADAARQGRRLFRFSPGKKLFRYERTSKTLRITLLGVLLSFAPWPYFGPGRYPSYGFRLARDRYFVPFEPAFVEMYGY